MQGQRSGAGLFHGFEQGSTPNDAGLDQQMFWNNIENSGLSPPSNFMASSSYDINVHDYHGQPFSGWDFLESSSMSGQNVGSLNDQKAIHGWSPINAFDGNVLLPESQEHGHSNAHSAGNVANGSLFVQNSGSSQLPQDLNNSGFVGEDDDCQILEFPPVFNKRRNSRTQPIPSSASNPSGMPNGSSSNSRLVSRKRKALDGIVEPCGSGSGSTSHIPHSNSSLWHPIPTAATPMGASSLGLNLLEQVNPSLGSNTRQVASRSSTLSANSGSVETSRRNTRPRINGTHQQGSQSSSTFNIASATGNTNLSSRQPSRNSLTIRPPTAAATPSTNPGAQPVAVQPSISLHRNLQPAGNSRNSLTIRPPTALAAAAASTNPRPPTAAAAAASTNPGAQPVAVQPSISLHRNLQPTGNSSSCSRTRNSSSVPVSGERSGASVNPSSSRGVSRTISAHPMLAQLNESRNFLPSAPSFGIANGNVNNPGNVALSSQNGSGANAYAHPTVSNPSNIASSSQNGAGANAHAHPAAPSFIPHQSPLQHISRSTERTLLPVVDAGFIAQNSSQPSLHSGSSLSQGVSLSSGSRRHSRPSQSRQPMLLVRPTVGAVGGLVPAQAFAASPESMQQRIAALLQIHREVGQLQAEMVALDPAVRFEMIDMHDRHRDMRLDVDNMSYEQLLALEERMGNVNVGLSEESIVKQLKQKKHTRRNVDKTETEPCCICQEEYNVGEVVGMLDCGHDFHSQCIKQWLMQKNICPICKTTGLTTQ